MKESIFTKIIKGEIPCHKIYEDDKTLAFLDIHPVQLGMVLVVSKMQVANFMDLPEEDYIALWQTIKKVARHLRECFPQKKRIGVQVEGLDVDHVHVKLFPIDNGEEFRKEPDFSVEPDHNALAEMAKKLAF
jgi:histidine triad (HIT) family protein